MADYPTDNSDSGATPYYMPSKLQTLGMMLSGLGSGIGAAAAHNLPFYFGVAPGAQQFQNSYGQVLNRGLNYDLALKNYNLQNSYKKMQEQQLGLQTEQLKRNIGFQDQALKWLQGGDSGASAPGFRPPQPGMAPDFRSAIAGNESAGAPNNGYGAVGPANPQGQRAYGKYQVMDFNIPSWTKEVLGQEMTPEQFLASPKAQDAVFDAKFGQSVKQYGNPQDAASVWFSGKPLSGNNAADVTGTTVPQYVNKFNRNLYGGNGAPTQVADTSASPVPPGAPGAPPSASPAGANSAPPGVPQMPGPPPDTTRLDAVAGMNLPGMSGIAKAQSEQIQRQYKFQVDNYMRQFDAWKTKNQIANDAVTIDPVTHLPTVNQTVAQAAAAKAAAEEKAKAQAHADYVFPQGINDTDKTAEQKLALLPPNIASIMKGIHEGTYGLSDLQNLRSAAGLEGSKVDFMSLGPAIYGKDWDPRLGDRRKDFVKYMQPGEKGGDIAGSISNASQHLADAADAYNQLRNGQYPIANKWFNEIATQNGWDKATSFDTIRQAIGTEIAKVISSGSDNSVTERDAAREVLSHWNSPDQMAGVFERYAGLIEKRRNTQYAQAKNVKLGSDYIDNAVGEPGTKALESLHSAVLPSRALKQLKEGQVTPFNNGQKWTLQGGVPTRVQ